jgi:hypothetical protein
MSSTGEVLVRAPSASGDRNVAGIAVRTETREPGAAEGAIRAAALAALKEEQPGYDARIALADPAGRSDDPDSAAISSSGCGRCSAPTMPKSGTPS